MYFLLNLTVEVPNSTRVTLGFFASLRTIFRSGLSSVCRSSGSGSLDEGLVFPGVGVVRYDYFTIAPFFLSDINFPTPINFQFFVPMRRFCLYTWCPVCSNGRACTEYVFAFAECVVVALYGLFVRLSPEATPGSPLSEAAAQEVVERYYPFFQDVHVIPNEQS